MPGDERGSADDAMLKLYGGARSRAAIAHWYLEEKGLDYEFVQLDMEAGEHRQPAFLEINPVGKVPAITDGGFKLWESGAILLYLAEKAGELTAHALQARMETAQWVIFANATLAPNLFMESAREREMPKLIAPLEQTLGERSFLLGEELTAADVAVGAYLTYAQLMLDLTFDGYPQLQAYLERLSQREAFQKTIGTRSA